MPLSEYATGLGLLAVTLAATGATTQLVAGRRFGAVHGVPAGLLYALLFSLGLIAAHAIPLALGVLTRGSVPVAAVALCGAAALLPRTGGAGPRAGAEQAPAPDRRLSPILATIAAATVGVFALAVLRGRLAAPLEHVDMLNFHLPGLARWIQSGSLWQVEHFFPYYPAGNYPNSGDLVTLATALPWRDVALARFAPAAFLTGTAVAVYALAIELRAPRASALTLAMAAVATPAAATTTFEGLPDSIMFFGFVTGVLFVIRHLRTGLTVDLVAAGLGLGLALGTKWYGLTSALAVLVVWGAALALRREPARGLARAGATVVVTIALAGGIWMLRNLVESGNPIFPQPVGAFGFTIFDGPATGLLFDRFGFTIAGYLDDPGVLADYIVPGFWDQLGLAGPAILLGGLVAAALTLRRLRSPARTSADQALLVVAGSAALVTVLYALTPGSAFGPEGEPVQMFTNVRWVVPALLLAAAATASLAGRLGRAGIAVEIAAVVAVADGVLRGAGTSLAHAAQVGLALAVLGCGLRLLRGRRSLIRALKGRRPRTTRIALAALVATALALAGLWQLRNFPDRPYAPADATLAWLEENASANRRVGLAGIWSASGVSPVFGAFGPGLRNSVRFVGPSADGLVREYPRQRSFARALRDGGYEILIVGRGQPPRPRAREEAWARSAGFKLAAASERLALYALPERRPPAAGRRPSGSSSQRTSAASP